MKAGRRLHQVAQSPINAVANTRAVLLRFNVNITGLITYGRQHGHIDQIHDGAAFHGLVKTGRYLIIGCLFFNDLNITVGKGRQERIYIRVATGTAYGCLLDKIQDIVCGCQNGANLAPGEFLEPIDLRE